MTYKVAVPKPVEKQLDKLQGTVYKNVIKRILELKDNPRPPGNLSDDPIKDIRTVLEFARSVVNKDRLPCRLWSLLT
ncbi:hypothetical protein GWO43_02770 [candidate division KSB1 bacterium]|nr:hypothetical protein [candidate division KSB1 bacterium]NIR69856.1 hypothetical protein [candidate division KSB1 bacterium]NIT69833.1 hypothetical protein [candidate division KSB1 bacterium]NIU25755.1 hypothetical protein [candidate division KSB1 bacterium]NIV93267.1 hypothetical protein [candidate division KSB1 bacterium]